MRVGALDRFDRECDVLVAGFGCAGAAVAFEAADAGADVLVLERAGGPGGSAAASGGELYLGGGTAIQRACGFEDTPEDMFAFLCAALGPHADEHKLRLYCDGSVEHFEWLRARGVEFRPTLHDVPGWMPPTDDGLMWLGEEAWPYPELARPAPRGHRPPAPFFAGRTLMDRLVAAAIGAGAAVAADTRATALALDADGRVAGVRARSYGRPLRIRARRAVVLTTGGFADDPEMVARFAPALAGHGSVSDGLDDGSGIRMATAIGADLRAMSAVQTALSFVPAVAARGMLVDAHGHRFINEDAYPGLVSTAAVHHRPGPYWSIIDQKGYESIPERDLWGVRPDFVCATTAELEESLGMPEGALASTVSAYNRHAARGDDPYFHKARRWLHVLEPPFAAIDPRRGFPFSGRPGPPTGSGASGFTLGGLRTDDTGAVLHTSGIPIPGLYAAGRASSGIHGQGYISGTSLGDATFFGRRAGRAAAGEPRRPLSADTAEGRR